jgi:aminoglycoside 6'-N-acetyltransferase
MNLRGDRVTLRSATPSDEQAFGAILREPEVAAWWGAYPPERVRADLFDDEETVTFAIEVDAVVIGLVTYWEENEPDYRHAGIDIALTTPRQGEGLGGEAVAVLARHLFDERGHHRLTIDPAAANTRAIRAYEKIGFRAVGVMRRYERGLDGTWRDGILMDLLSGELIPTSSS